VLGPAAFFVLLALTRSLPAAQGRLAAVVALTVVFWITEAIPIPATALLAPTLCVLLGIAPAREVFAPFSDPVIFLFIGSFLIARAISIHGLDRRFALGILGLPGVGRSPARILLAFGAATAFLSLWISNTATAAIMLPIALSLADAGGGRRGGPGQEGALGPGGTRAGSGGFAEALLLMTAFAASVGGIGTPVGTPPNLIGIGMIRRQLGIEISFLHWMLFGIPAVLALFAVLHVSLARGLGGPGAPAERAAEEIRAERARLGPLSTGEKSALLAFLVTVGLWIGPGLYALVVGPEHPSAKALTARVPEAAVALVGALLLFVLPRGRGGTGGAGSGGARRFALTWEEGVHIDWGTILLFGGGLALGDLMFRTGLAEAIGSGLRALTRAETPLGLTLLFTGMAILVSETTSNTASANMVIPVAIATAQAAGVDPLAPALGACLGASMGFMLPVSTPPNAIVYGSGRIPIATMARKWDPHGCGRVRAPLRGGAPRGPDRVRGGRVRPSGCVVTRRSS
jgi:sodium-dependent dicarboxylate transporter 2/3/5